MLEDYQKFSGKSRKEVLRYFFRLVAKEERIAWKPEVMTKDYKLVNTDVKSKVSPT